ncbi:hypothetical protein G7Y89_g1537 [Cudoniella acicularis]|uniref:Uncharacterized protein n=1 Tax=Cudoniella acicularis TaxID=354080 RepID=A0A8H4RWW5_9HELO|nr:hypothetical protein G7Y89_g1537 [Cudoniella acicularis]
MLSALSQPKLYPLPTGIDLTGRTAIVTGASSGLGLETARQLLVLRATVILAVRNPSKAEACKAELLADASVKKNNPKAVVKIMRVDMEDPHSVVKFAEAVEAEVPIVDYLILNAGIAALKFGTSASGHESIMQVNYLANVVLLAALLPHLEASADKTGRPVRIAWVGSRRHVAPSWGPKTKKPVKKDENIFKYMDNPKNFDYITKYGDTKTLCTLFMYELAPRLNTNKIILNMMCPGTVTTAMGSDMPIYIRVVIGIIRAIKGRTPEEGSWVVLHSALVADSSSHGKFLVDKDVCDKAPYLASPAGLEFQKKLWNETMEDIKPYVALPPVFAKKA